jgi:hypothetical protein
LSEDEIERRFGGEPINERGEGEIGVGGVFMDGDEGDSIGVSGERGLESGRGMLFASIFVANNVTMGSIGARRVLRVDAGIRESVWER